MQVRDAPGSADVMIALGSIDDRVATYAARLADEFSYTHIVFTGGSVPRNTRQASWAEATEAEHFAAVFRATARLRHEILLETHAQHTGENATLSYELLANQGISRPATVQLVTKPYMERRAVGTFEAQWPDRSTTFVVTSHPCDIREYCTTDYPIAETVRIMLKDFENMQRYAKLGWQSPVTVPRHILQAAEEIKRAVSENKIR